MFFDLNWFDVIIAINADTIRPHISHNEHCQHLRQSTQISQVRIFKVEPA